MNGPGSVMCSALYERWIAMLWMVFTVACGGIDPVVNGGNPEAGSPEAASGDAGEKPTGQLLPWATGNSWTYRITDTAGVVSEKVQTVGEQQLIGGSGPAAGELAYYTRSEKKDGTDLTESWQALVGQRVLRYRERAYKAGTTDVLTSEEHWDPYKLRVDGTDEHTVTGADWVEIYQETKLPVGGAPLSGEARDRWTVVSDSETVDVPAGTFHGTIHFRKIGPTSTKDYWYLRGVGKIKETGSQTEELVRYEVGE